MTEFAGWQIKIGVDNNRLMNWTQGVDGWASALEFQKLLVQQVEQEFPGARIVIGRRTLNSGIIKLDVSSPDNDDASQKSVMETVMDISDNIWQDGDWVVAELENPDDQMEP